MVRRCVFKFLMTVFSIAHVRLIITKSKTAKPLSSPLSIPFASEGMLDWSDEESESVHRRNYSPSHVLGSAVNVKPIRYFDKKEHGFPLNPQKTFREIKNRSSNLIMQRTTLPSSDAFFINEFVREKLVQPNSEPEGFDESLKGHNPVFRELAQNRADTGCEDHPDSFFKSMKTIVFLSQFFAVLPVSGYEGPNYKSLSFKWFHIRTCYWFFTFLGTLFCLLCSVTDIFKHDSFQTASEMIFFVCGIISSLLMLNLSRNWKQINKEFAEAEVKLKKYGYPKKIGFKFHVFTISILCGALVEHLLSKLKNFQQLGCDHQRTGHLAMVETFFLIEYHHLFSVIPFNLWLAFFLCVAQFLATANWNFKDLFLCLISWTIAERFKQIHILLDSVHGEEKPISFWKEVRENYNTLTVLTKRVDARVQKLMLLSLGNNVFFICMQLFHSLKEKLNLTKLVYFFWSFGFLVLRASFVAFSAARINDESKEPKTVLYSVPQKNYTAEVRRFLTQLTTNEVALTGSGFFSVTRSLILTITGTVITYEIVLAQFGNDNAEEVPTNATICSLLHP